MRVGRTVPGNLYNHGVSIRPRKMIVADPARLRVHAAWRKCLQRLRIKMIAVAKMPFARNYNCHAIVFMGVRLDRGVSGHEQQNRVKPSLRWITEKHFRVNSRQAGTPDLIAAKRALSDFR